MDLSKFTKFLGHHANDLDAISTALKLVVTLLPIGQQDKDNALSAVTSLEHAATNIRASVEGVKGAVKDVKDGVAAVKGKPKATPAPKALPKPGN